MMHGATEEIIRDAAGYGPPGGPPGFGPPGGPPGFGPPPGGGGYGAPPGGGSYGPPPVGAPPGFGAPPGGGFGPPGGFPPPGGPMLPTAGGPVNTTLPLVISIVSLFCCGVGTIGGIVGIVFALQAKGALDQGQIDDARGKAKVALIVSLVCAGVQILGIIAYWLIVAVFVAANS